MSKDTEVQQELKQAAHKIWLAGLGALAVAGEEGRALFQTLVARGEEYEARNAERVAKVRETVAEARASIGARLEQVHAGVDEQVAKALQRLGVPSRDEIAELTRRVEELTRSLESARKAPPRGKAE